MKFHIIIFHNTIHQLFNLYIIIHPSISIIFLLHMSKKHNKQVHDFIVNKINIFIEPLVYELVLQKPTDPVEYAIQWLGKYQQKMKNKSTAHLDSGSEDEALDEVKELQTRIASKKNNKVHHKSRVGISQEVFGLFNCRDDFTLNQDSSLSQDQKILVKSLIRNSIFLQNLDNRDEQIILQAITSKETDEFQMIIKEGEPGDVLYIVESGEYDCYKLIEDENVYIKTYMPGQAFGQLALMYNAPRAASIVTKKPGKLLILNRCTFSHVIKVAAFRKKEIIRTTIQKIEILRTIPNDEREQLVNILKEERYHQGEYVIRQGELGSKFYIVLQGTLVAQKRQGDDLPKIVYKYEEGDYFGQLALINNQPRQASIRALTSSKLACVTHQGFKRVFGPLTEAFIQQSKKYE